MFAELGRAIRSEVVLHLFHAELAPEEAQQQLAQSQTAPGAIHYEHETAAGADVIDAALGGGGAVAAPVAQAPARQSELDKIGRNDPCWCGSGKKFKKCHGQ